MPFHAPRPLAIVALAATMGLALSAAPREDVGDVAARRDAESMKRKVAAITGVAVPAKQVRRTVVTESEVNAYLTYEAGDRLPAGVVEPSVNILGSGRLSGRAVVDLDAVRKARGRTSLLDPRNFLTGHLPVVATGTLVASGGVARFAFESGSVGGIPIPKVFLDEIVSYYSKTPDKPAGVSIDDAFPMPAGIREIQVGRGQAVIVQ